MWSLWHLLAPNCNFLMFVSALRWAVARSLFSSQLATQIWSSIIPSGGMATLSLYLYRLLARFYTSVGTLLLFSLQFSPRPLSWWDSPGSWWRFCWVSHIHGLGEAGHWLLQCCTGHCWPRPLTMYQSTVCSSTLQGWLVLTWKWRCGEWSH